MQISSRVESMLSPLEPEKIDMRVWLIIQEGERRGFRFEPIDYKKPRFRVLRNGRGFTFEAIPGFLAFRKANPDFPLQRKEHKKQKMAEVHMPVPETLGIFKTHSDLLKEQLPYPLVAKPVVGSFSKNVYTNINSQEELISAAKAIEATREEILVEKHIPGDHFRILVVDHQYIGCAERRAANVTGDGQHTISELIELRNQEPGRAERDATHTTNHKIVFDTTSEQILKEKSLTSSTILPRGRMLKIQHKITAALGSDYVDYTDKLHKSIVEKCISFTKHFRAFVIGFDLIASDITKPLEETGGAFNEYNMLPYIDLNENPNIGKKQNAARTIWNKIDRDENTILTPHFLEF